MCHKKSLKFSLIFITVFIFSAFIDVQARITHIWYIGRLEEEDFVSQQEKVIEYLVPSNWYDLLFQDDPNWGKFPKYLYSEVAGEDKPQEVRISFNYNEDYFNPTLYINVKREEYIDQNVYHHIVIYKGEKDEIGRCLIETSSYTCVLPLGYLEKGLLDQNKIVIKVESPSEIPIEFDSLWVYQDETDTDGDGISDDDEGGGDVSVDSATASLPIESYNPKDMERITLHIEGVEGSSPCFGEVRFLDANSLNLPEQIKSNYYFHFPYSFLGFRADGIDSQEEAALQITYMDPLYPYVRFYTFQDNGEWQEIDFEILSNNNSVKIVLKDGGTGDFDKQEDGSINTKLTLAYPRGLGVQIDKSGCFIEGIVRNR